MNRVFYILSVGLMSFALWFVFGLPVWLCSLYTLVAWTFIARLPQRFLDYLSDLEKSAKGRKLQEDTAGQITFAPIDDYQIAALANQLTSDMTIRDIEDFIFANTNDRSSITAKATVVERQSLISDDE